jgi:hypothetical protein
MASKMEEQKRVVMILIDEDDPDHFVFLSSKDDVTRMNPSARDKPVSCPGIRHPNKDCGIMLDPQPTNNPMKPRNIVFTNGGVSVTETMESIGDDNATHSTEDRGTNQPRRKRKWTARRQPKAWTAVEKNAVAMGVRMFGVGNWIEIKSHYSEELRERTNVDIKDCYRRLQPWAMDSLF